MRRPPRSEPRVPARRAPVPAVALLPLVALLALGACTTRPPIYLPDAVAEVRTVAAVYFTVPARITSHDLREPDPQEAPSIRAWEDNGRRAATEAHRAFLKTLAPDAAELPFALITYEDLVGNAAFRDMPRPEPPPDPMAEAEGFMETLSAAFTSRWGDPSIREGAAPEQLSEFGLRDWDTLYADRREQAYVLRALETLDVDAALLIVDRGFRFRCTFCMSAIGTGANGDATTASGAVFALVNRDGRVVVKGRVAFGETPAREAVSLGVIDAEAEDRLFAAHGRTLAAAFVAAWAELAANPPPPPEPE